MYMKSRAQGFGAEVKRRILIGTYVLSHGYYDAYYLQAQRIRRLIANDFVEAFKVCDVIMGPTSPSTAFKLGEKAADPVQMYLSDIYTIAVNLAGLPGMSIPCGFAGGLPVGLQLIGNYFAEARLLNAAHRYQQATDWHRSTGRKEWSDADAGRLASAALACGRLCRVGQAGGIRAGTRVDRKPAASRKSNRSRSSI
jgi:aspartyl-tRNA(Asn)/glutamyl-tRNA(Gln) amidotransferase subunit A